MRTFLPEDLVGLPHLSAVSAIALGSELLTARSSVGKVPAAVSKAYGRLERTLGELKRIAVDKLAPTAVDSPRLKAADRTLDGAWGALFDWLCGWVRLPEGTTEARAATRILAALFPEGLKFTQLRYKEEWGESQLRVERIHADKLDAAIRDLGGAPFLRNIEAAHRAYGEALGITAQKPAPTPLARTREPLDAFLSALRTYVLQVAASADPEAPATAALAETLLRPVVEWRSTSRSETAPAAGDAPEPTAPPAASAP